MQESVDMVGKDLANIVDLKATAVEKKSLVGGIKQMDVMELLVEKGDIDALQSLVLIPSSMNYKASMC